jgi:two-component system chemotaxis response regulator CheY
VAPRILICDDAIFMRTMIADILTGAGYEVAGQAESGLQAVERYKTVKPDLVTMDIVMPDMGGIDAVKAIVAIDPDARIQAGAKDFVVKPFQPARVLEAVQRVLGG